MKKVLLIGGLAILVAFGGFYFLSKERSPQTSASLSQPKNTQLDKNQVSLKSLSSSSFASKTAQKKGRLIKLHSHYLLKNGNLIKFIDKEGNVIKVVELPPQKEGKSWVQLFFSPDRRVVAINFIQEYEKEIPKKAKAKLFSEDGNELWEVEHNMSSLSVDPKADYLFGVVDESYGKAPLQVYNASGFVKAFPKDTRCWLVAYDEDRIAILLQRYRYSQYITSVGVYDRATLTPIWKRNGVAVGESCGFELKLKGDKVTLTHYAKGTITYSIE